MTGSRPRVAFLVALCLCALLAASLQGVRCDEELESVPSEDLCRPYIEKALKHLGTGSLEQTSAEEIHDANEKNAVDEESVEENVEQNSKEDIEENVGETSAANDEADRSVENALEDANVESEEKEEEEEEQEKEEQEEEENEEEEEKQEEKQEEEVEEQEEEEEQEEQEEQEEEQKEREEEEEEAEAEKEAEEGMQTSTEDEPTDLVSEEAQEISDMSVETVEDKTEGKADESEELQEQQQDLEENKNTEEHTMTSDELVIMEAADETSHENNVVETMTDTKDETPERSTEVEEDVKVNISEDDIDSEENDRQIKGNKEEVEEEKEEEKTELEERLAEQVPNKEEKTFEEDEEEVEEVEDEEEMKKEEKESEEGEREEGEKGDGEEKGEQGGGEGGEEGGGGGEGGGDEGEEEDEGETIVSRSRRQIESNEEEKTSEEQVNVEAEKEDGENDTEADNQASVRIEEEATTPEEDLIQQIEIPENLRPRDHINQLLKLDQENEEKEHAIEKVADIILRDLKKLYDNAIQPLETLYKYRDLSNRHFGDPEIFSKPLILFMGPWSGGKSSIINYLLNIEYKVTALRTGAEPSPAYFNIIMYGEEEEVLDGTQLAADWTFSGLQKFGQGLLDRLRGLRLNNKLLEKVNIVEIPGILEIRKQVQRLFPFNDACQWFIDRADIIFLVYDPSKLDVGPETEAILDQLKGREYQTRIILNKADQVKPEELMRVQGALIWNISPLMSSAEPPIMYSTSLWSLPYEAGAPTRLLYAQERAFLRDLRVAIDRRVEHKIASARRFAVRVRNHAKMVDCYLTTYYNHKTFFANKKEISDKIIDNPQDYHIYEGLSTLTNISRYDLPDPDVYRDFFRLNPLYDFQLLSSTCTYFRGCPINRLDVAIAYDLPELVGKYKKSVESVIQESETNRARS